MVERYQMQPGETPDLRLAQTVRQAETERDAHLHEPQVRVGTGVQRFEQWADGHQTFDSSLHRGNATSAPAVTANPLSTARTETGRLLTPAEALADPYKAIVAVNGATMRLVDAQRVGLIAADAAANALAPTPQPQQQPQEQHQQQPEAPQLEAFADREADKAVDTLVKGTQPSTQLAVIRHVIENGSVSRGMIEQAASEAGTTPDVIGALLGGALSGFQSQADAAVESVAGVPAEEVYEWARTNRAADLKAAMRSIATDRTTAGFRDMARAYMSDLDKINPEALLAAETPEGVRLTRQGGKIIVHWAGRTYEWKSAVAAGLISVSRGKK